MKFTGTLKGAKVIGNYTVSYGKSVHTFESYERADEYRQKNGGTLSFKVDPNTL